MEIVHIDQITVAEDRQRSEIDEKELQELAKSIAKDGLIHAPIVTKDLRLVAGERRVEAIKLLEQEYVYDRNYVPPGHIPVVKTASTDPRALHRIELEENIRRVDLSPVDRARALAGLHQIRVEEAVEAQLPTPTVKDTAQVVAEMRGKDKPTSEQRELADAIILDSLADHPEVQKQKTHSGAVKAAKQIMERQMMEAIGHEESCDDGGNVRLVTGDAREVLGIELESGSVDCYVVDPPYGIGADSFGEQSTVEGHEYSDSWKEASSLIRDLARLMAEYAAPECHAYVFCDIRRFSDVADIFAEEGWHIWSTPLIWNKGSSGHAPRPGFGPRRSYEALVFCSRGNKRVAATGNDVLSFNAVRDKKHGAEKPVDLLEHLLKWSCIPGDLVVDPTCGVGSTLLAARNLGLSALGVELNDKYAAIGRARLAEHDSGGHSEDGVSDPILEAFGLSSSIEEL